MGFQTPKYKLADFLAWARNGEVQLPDFQRGYKWDDERIRSLLTTILMGHPLGVVMMLQTNNAQVRFKPKPIEGSGVPVGTEPKWLLLDGQQRLTSLTQALTGDGVVATKDSRGKLLSRRYYLKIDDALADLERLDDAVISIPGDGIVKANFDRDIVLDLSTGEKERAEGYFPLRLLTDTLAASEWLFELDDKAVAQQVLACVVAPAAAYEIPAIALDESTSRAAVATVFEKVNTGGLPLNVFELLTATFAGDPHYYAQHGTDFRLNDDWQETKDNHFAGHRVLTALENTDFLQATTLLVTRERQLAATGERRPAISARRADILKLTLDDYLRWRDELRDGFVWASTFLADHHVFDPGFLPYPKQLVPLAAIKVILGHDADAHAIRKRVDQWFWCGILGELYGGAIENRFARDIEEVPDWVRGGAVVPRTVDDAVFVQSRLWTLRTRNAAAYKGMYALLLANGAKDWMFNQSLGQVQYIDLAVDIHHIFPQHWCNENGVEMGARESIVNKTPIAARTNRIIGGKAPSKYLVQIQQTSQLDDADQDAVLATHLVDAHHLRSDDMPAFLAARAEALCVLVERAMGKPVPRADDAPADSEQFDPEDEAVRPDDTTSTDAEEED